MEKIIRVELEKIPAEILKEVNPEEFLQEMKKRGVEVEEIILLNDEPELKEYLLNDMEIDLDYDVVYPEGGFDLIKYDSVKETLDFGGCRYLLMFIQKDPSGDEYIWYSGYRDISNLNREIRLWDLENSI